jgi:hypothetical protein
MHRVAFNSMHTCFTSIEEKSQIIVECMYIELGAVRRVDYDCRAKNLQVPYQRA